MWVRRQDKQAYLGGYASERRISINSSANSHIT